MKLDPNTIKDEMCSCGHLKSEHATTTLKGHGACTKCDCFQFTWNHFIYKDRFFILVREYEDPKSPTGGLTIHMFHADDYDQAYEKAQEEYGNNNNDLWVFTNSQFTGIRGIIDRATIHYDECDNGDPCDPCLEVDADNPAEFYIYSTADREGGASQKVCSDCLAILENKEF